MEDIVHGRRETEDNWMEDFHEDMGKEEDDER